jgi:hypothetical protein
MSLESRSRTVVQVFIERILRDAAEFGWQMRAASMIAPPGAVTLEQVRAEAVTLAFDDVSEAVEVIFTAARLLS